MKKNIELKEFRMKFIDIMIGVVLGLGFQWWPNLDEPWKIAAFIFAYIDIIDFWVDYGPSLKKFPPKKEINVFLDIAIVFSLFLYIYSTQLSINYFILSFSLWKLFDLFWLSIAKKQYYGDLGKTEKTYLNTWIITGVIDIIIGISVVLLTSILDFSAAISLVIFIILRLIFRIIASFQYKKAYL